MPPSQTEHQGTVSPDVLEVIVERIVEVADPERIILFGSAARGEMGLHSDVDVLVVKENYDTMSRGELIEEIYMNLIGVAQAVDIVIATPTELEEYRDNSAVIISPALSDGREVYHAQKSASS